MGRSKKGLTLAIAELYPPQGEWTEEDYFNLPDTNRYIELSEGSLIMPPHPTYRHQRALLELYTRLRTFSEENDLGQVLVAPLPVRLWPGKIREPDIFFIANEHSDRIGERVCGVPDLVVEVTSPGTRRVDRMEKFAEYAKAGVSEYWLVDPEEGAIEVYILKEGAYMPLGTYGLGEVAQSQLLSGFQVVIDEILERGKDGKG